VGPVGPVGPVGARRLWLYASSFTFSSWSAMRFFSSA
jgi:hypothetical protein